MEDSVANTYILQRKIEDFRYSPLVRVETVDQETGEMLIELQLEDDSNESKIIGNMYVLMRYRLNGDGSVATDSEGTDLIEPISIANAVILKLALETSGSPDRVAGLALALVHYFQFLDDNKLEWHHMPRMKAQRPTYRFQRHLMDMANIKLPKGVEPNPEPYKASTVKSMIREIVKFYKCLEDRYGFEFDFRPFNAEDVSITYNTSSANDMEKHKKRRIPSTDLRIKGRSITEKDRLMAMSDTEWGLFDNQSRIERFGIETDGTKRKVSENNIRQFQICRFSGLRADEVASLHSGNIIKPTNEDIERNTYVDFNFGPQYGNRTKGGTTNRVCEMPARLMYELFKYVRSEGYIALEQEYKKTAVIRHQITKKPLKENPLNTPLFLNRITKNVRKGMLSGAKVSYVDSVSSKTISNRFGEIVRFLKIKHNCDFPHTVHNLRSTYAVRRMEQYHEAFIKAGVDPARAWSKAITSVKGRLGHLSILVTDRYLRQAQSHEGAFAMSERVQDFAIKALPSRFNKK
ncbi:hypothetical protein [Vibrio sp. 1S139]|uniref:hypothetical protein n=1 Tax=Vibrio sp. 1S139 TaxID=3230006 RepID=UPI00352D4493